MFGHDDGVVYDDADAEHENEQRDRVYGEVEQQHDRQRANERHDEPDRDPDRQPEREKQGERQENQQETQPAVPEQQIDPLGVRLRLIVQDRQADPLGKGRDDLFGDVIVHGPCDLHDLFALGPGNLNERSRQALVADDQVDVLELVAHLGDIAEPEHRAVAAGQHDDVLEVMLIVALAERTHTHLRIARVDTAGGQVERTAPHGGGDVR